VSASFEVSKKAVLDSVKQARESGDLGHIAMAMRKCPPGSRITIADTSPEPGVYVYVDGYAESVDGEVDWTGVHAVIIIDDDEYPMETEATFRLEDCTVLERSVTEEELEAAMKGEMS
jgi:hypothetical protein